MGIGVANDVFLEVGHFAFRIKSLHLSRVELKQAFEENIINLLFELSQMLLATNFLFRRHIIL